ncbi:MAG: transglutaminase domain-containing protein [Chloroflexi bacterium]|nr:transglutaminase domain-containing protein [Chloroflexota bacterium]
MKQTSTRSWDFPSAAIMLAAVLFSAWRLQTANWAEGLEQIRNMALLGFAVGLALGYSRFQRGGVFLLSFAYFAASFVWQLSGAIEFNEDQTYILDKFAVMFGRLFISINELRAGRPVEDQFFVAALLCLPYWFVSLFSGFQLTRYANFLATALPSGILMFLVHVYHYTNRDYTWMFGGYLFLALVLLSRMKYLSDRRAWLQKRVQVSSESGLDIANTTVATAMLLVALAWGIPYTLPANTQGIQFWRKTVENIAPAELFENIFASINKEARPKLRNFLTELSLGTRAPQSDLVVFQVYAPQSAATLPRLYWRGQVYDIYENGTWKTIGEDETRRTSAQGDFEIPDSALRRRFGFTFDVRSEGQVILYAPPQPVWVNQNTILLYSQAPPNSEEDEEPILDIMAMRASPPLKMGDLYRASAMIANPTIDELRNAGSEYPDWVAEKYLQLPDDFSPRIQELALKITDPHETPYDKAAAITNYLRREIEYTNVVYPPEASDPMEFFLFDSKKGFCNYYASAQVLMLRSIGIPARLAVGYAQGESNYQKSVYVVRERDLHAWPEVYFPQIGWVEFEPTVNQDALERPLEREELNPNAAPFVNPAQQNPAEEAELPPLELDEEEAAPAANWVNGLAPALPWLGGVFFLLLMLTLKQRFAPQVTAASFVKRAIEHSGLNPPRWLNRWLMFAESTPIQRHFHSINISLSWMKRPQGPHITAGERAWILKHILPSASDSIETLLREHQAELFGRQSGNESLARRAAWDIFTKTIQRRLKIAILGYNYAETQDTPQYPL